MRSVGIGGSFTGSAGMVQKNIDEMKRFSNVPNKIMVANIGSSHGECDFVYDDLEKQGITGFNFGIQAQTIEYDEKVFDNFVGKMAKNSYLIIPISYMTFMLSDDSLDEETFKLKNYRYYSFMKYRNMIGVTFKEYFKVKYLAFSRQICAYSLQIILRRFSWAKRLRVRCGKAQICWG